MLVKQLPRCYPSPLEGAACLAQKQRPSFRMSFTSQSEQAVGVVQNSHTEEYFSADCPAEFVEACDVVLKAEDAAQFRAHRAVLMRARCVRPRITFSCEGTSKTFPCLPVQTLLGKLGLK